MQLAPTLATFIARRTLAPAAVPLERLCRVALLVSACLVLAACGSGSRGVAGGAASDGAPDTPLGSASVFITDAPSDEFDRILVTIDSLELIGAGPTVTLFSGSETIDLKDLESFSDLFVLAENVPAREYDKIRMQVSRIQLVANGVVPEIIEVELPANGKIDLIPRGSFFVQENVNLVIELDLDAQKSIQLVSNANQRYRFRPVVFIEIRNSISPRKLARVHGKIREIFDDQNFVLCSTLFMASRDPLEPRGFVEEGGLGHRYHCMTVELNDLTGVFDTEGDPIPAFELLEGSEVTVVGRFHLVDGHHDVRSEVNPLTLAAHGDLPRSMLDSSFEHRLHRQHQWVPSALPSGNPGLANNPGIHADELDPPQPPHVRLVLLAYVIEIGPPSAFLRLRGTVASQLDTMNQFDFAIGPGQGFGSDSVVKATLQRGTRVFTRSGIEVNDSEITPVTRAQIDGVLQTDPAAPSLLKLALLILNKVETPVAIRGKITLIESAARRILLEVAGTAGTVTERCVDVPKETDIFVIREAVDGVTRKRGSFDELKVGWNLQVYGHAGVSRCLVAKTILAFPPPLDPVRCRTADHCGLDQFCKKPDQTCDTAGLCAPAPRVCTRQYVPVCGCDGTTYGNRCEANRAGTSISHQGVCLGDGDVCGGIAGLPCPSGSSCQFRDGLCQISDAQGVCRSTPDACPTYMDPVCGCDGRTYSNRCFASMAGVMVSSMGRCPSVSTPVQ